MKTITAKVDTKLKKQPIASSLLAPRDAIAVAAGKSYGVNSISPAANGHSKVVLAANSGTFYVFNLHWNGLFSITRQQAETIFGNPISDSQLNDLNQCLTRYEINTSVRMRHFLSQVAHESLGMQLLKELDLGWYIPERFNLPAIADPDGGYAYRGAGALQLSMPENYLALSKEMGDPDIYMRGCSYVAEKYPVSSAGWWWKNNDMNKLCDSGASVLTVSRAVNLGNPLSTATPNGLSDRQSYYKIACGLI